MKALTLAFLVAALTAACEPAGTQFRTTVFQPDGSYPIAVVLGDETGLVISIESALGDNLDGKLPHVQPDTEDPNAVIVSWGTGACDNDVGVAFQRSGAGYRLGIAVHDGFSLGGCTAQLLVRRLRVRFSETVPVDSIAVFGGR